MASIPIVGGRWLLEHLSIPAAGHSPLAHTPTYRHHALASHARWPYYYDRGGYI